MSGQSSQSIDNRPEVEVYFCVLCTDVSKVLCFKTKSELKTHLRATHLKDSSADESHAIDLWLERHIKYQESLNKSMAQTIKTVPDRNKTIYKGCPVCDRIIKVFNIQSESYLKGPVTHELLIRDINVDYSGNNVNHINPHLKYYPYECLICKDECEKSRQKGDPDIKEVVKTSVKAMMRRHIIDRHLRKSPLIRDALEEEIEKSILTLKVMVLERITKKQCPSTKPPVKKRKIKSIPGPLRRGEKSEPLKRLHPILPTFIMKALSGSDKYLIPMASVVPHPKNISILSPLPSQPLMTSTPIKNAIKNEIKSGEELSSSEEELSDFNFDLIEDKSEVFGCLFCLKRFKTYDKVFDHYLIHCNVFIECAKCDKKFKTIGDFRSHNPLHNENSNLLNVNEYKTVRKWIEKFLDYLKNDRKTLLTMTCDVNRIYCSVCLMVSDVYNFKSKRVLAENETIESHIHNHMNYFPFECIDCNYEDIKTEFFLDSKAKKHLFEKHDTKNVSAMTQRELSTYFIDKNSSINRFNELIQQSVQITEQMNEFSSINSRFESITFK